MGSYCTLLIGSYSVIECKSYVLPELMTVFTNDDKTTERKKISEVYPDDFEEGDEDYDVELCSYRCSVSVAKERLDILGFDLQSTKVDFEQNKKLESEKFLDWSQNDRSDSFKEGCREVSDILTDATFEDFIVLFKELVSKRVHPCEFREYGKDKLGLWKYVCDFGPDDYLMSFPSSDVRFLIRLLLEITEDNKEIEIDFTELIDASYYEIGDNIPDLSREQLTADYPINSKIIILTEGSIDKPIIERSLQLLFPHLFEYYSFLDFDLSRSGGGAPNLVSTLKAFVGSGIQNRVIAVFDNDTAARTAMKSLSSVSFPKNIRIITYPEVEFLKSYPTLGPNGLKDMNVNSLAGSIEVYLGDNCLRESEGYIPVQWKGYYPELHAYHGEVLKKKQIQKKFLDILDDCEENLEKISSYDWSGVKAILQEIFEMFQNKRS